MSQHRSRAVPAKKRHCSTCKKRNAVGPASAGLHKISFVATSSQRNEIFLNSGGKCQSCGAEISLENFHADHIIPFSEGGITEIKNGQALCQKCNLAKGAKLKVDLSPWMPPGFQARGWQQDFWERAFRSIIQQVDLPPSEFKILIALLMSLIFLPIIWGTAPSLTRPIQIPNPIPFDPPVTMITLFFKFRFILNIICFNTI